MPVRGVRPPVQAIKIRPRIDAIGEHYHPPQSFALVGAAAVRGECMDQQQVARPRLDHAECAQQAFVWIGDFVGIGQQGSVRAGNAFDRTILRRSIIEEQDRGEKARKVNANPRPVRPILVGAVADGARRLGVNLSFSN